MIKRLLKCLCGIFPLCFILNGEVHAVVVNAKSCSRSDVQAAINSASKGDIISIPSGTCVWDAVVKNTKQITIQGNGIDKTTINCGSLTVCISIDVPPDLSPNSTTLLWRVTGFTFLGGGGDQFNGIIVTPVTSTGRNWRIDHNKFYDWNKTNAIWISSSYGVIDHNTFIIDTHTGSKSPIHAQGLINGVVDKGFAAWDIPYTWGTADAIFIEDNTFSLYDGLASGYGWPTDGEAGARFVFRYNTVINGTVSWHGFDSGMYRGAIGGEIYNNTFVNKNGSAGRAHHARSGVVAFHDNSISGYAVASINYPYRTDFTWDKNSWSKADGTQWWVCSNAYNAVCNPSISVGVPVSAPTTLIGDAWCVNRTKKSNSTCSLKFCSGDRDYLCNPASDPCPGLGKGTCSSYIDGSTNSLPWPLRDQPGVGPGGQISQPNMAWGNSYCHSGPTCTPVPTNAGILSGGKSSAMRENRDFFNCTSQSDCEAKTGTKYKTYPYPHPLIKIQNQ